MAFIIFINSYRRRYVEKEIRNANYLTAAGPKALEEENLTSMHYFGYETIREAYKHISLKDNARILDAGSGFGGCARYWAEQLGTTDTVVACEYNSEFCELSSIITKSMDQEVANRIENVCDDLTTVQFDGSKFDGVYSILVFLHVPKIKLPQLFTNLSNQMKDNAIIFIEDYYLDGEPSELLQSVGKDYIAWDDLPTKQALGRGQYMKLLETLEYTDAMKAAGFEVILFEDQTAQWQEYTIGRQKAYAEIYDDKVNMHGEENGPIQMKHFFDAVTKYFAEGGKGAKIIAKKIALAAQC